MRVTIEIEGPRAVGKTQLAQVIQDSLQAEYEVVALGDERQTLPRIKETYYYEISPR